MKPILFIILFVACFSIWAQDVQPCVPVVNTILNQTAHVVVSDGVGGSIIAWQDTRSGNSDIYAQRVDITGQMLWAINGVIVCSAENEQGQLSMVSDNLGGAIIAWQDARFGSYDIFAQRVNSVGTMQWTSDGIAICADASVQSPPKLASDGVSGAFITWSDNRTGDYDIFAQRINSVGTLFGTIDGTRLQLIPESSNQINPAICPDGAGGAILAYEQYITGFNDYDIYSQRINSSCAIVWSGGGIPACIAAYNQRNPRLANDGVGSAIIVWQDFINSANYDIYTQRVFSDAIQWTANGVPIKVVAYDQINPVITCPALNTAVIVWQDFVNGTNYDIYAQKIVGTTSGTIQWAIPGVQVCIYGGDQSMPQVVNDGNGGTIIVWQDGRDYGTNGFDIYGQNLDATGVITGGGAAGGYGICTMTADQDLPMLTNNANGTAIYAWMDYRSQSNWDIYTLGTTDIPLPVELSSFTASVVNSNLVTLNWITQSETNLMGYYVYRNATPDIYDAVMASPLIDATNTSQQVSYSYTDMEAGIGTWYYWLENKDLGGENSFHGPISVTVTDGDPSPVVIPNSTCLRSIYPNPFTVASHVSYDLSKADNVSIAVYNLKGQMVRSLVSDAKQAGAYDIQWNGKNDQGQRLPSGIYYIRMTAGEFISTQKSIIVR